MSLLFDTFLTLFGLPIMAGKVIKEKKYHKNYTDATQTQFSWIHSKEKELAAPHEEYARIKSSIGQCNFDACGEIQNELIEVFGPNYRDKMKEYYIVRAYPESTYDYHGRVDFWLRQMMLAKHGYIDKYYSTGILIFCDQSYTYGVAMCKQIEKMLHQAGHTDMLLYASNYPNPYGTPAIEMQFLSPEYVDACRSGRVRLSYRRLW